MVDKNNLIALVYSFNNCYTQISSIEKAERDFGLKLDLSKETWSWRGFNNIRIGSNRRSDDYRDGIIGVYDRTNDAHLDSMLSGSREATSRPNYFDD
jgi:hypothetical protein